MAYATHPKETPIKKHCYYCSQNIFYIDYKDAELIKRFLSTQAKIMSPRRTGTCAKHQRNLAQAVERARFLALVPYTNR